MRKVLFSTILILAVSTLLATNKAQASDFNADVLMGEVTLNEYYTEGAWTDFIAEEDLLSAYMEGISVEYDEIAEEVMDENELIAYVYDKGDKDCVDFVAEEDLLTAYMEGYSAEYTEIAEEVTDENELIVYVYDKGDKDCVDFVAEEDLLTAYMEGDSAEYTEIAEENSNIFKTIATATSSFLRNLI